MTPEERVLRLEANLHTLAAGQAALVCVLAQVIEAAQAQGLSMPDLEATFLQHRKEMFHHLLEQIERTDPARAAQIQAIVDEPGTQLPLGYE